MSDFFQGGATYVFQGTVAEDAGVGTHVSSMTVTPGAGNEFLLLNGLFIAGAGAANLTSIYIDDGTNVITEFISPSTSVASGGHVPFPANYTTTVAAAVGIGNQAPVIVAGTMRLRVTTSTATVSLTHTFAFSCRIKGVVPTVTLADSLGTPTLTTNTSKVF